MKTITVAESMEESLAFVPGNDLQEKFSRLLENTLVLHLRECEDYLFRYESKYGMDFSNFAELWKKGEIQDMRSHEVERDFMEWEGFVMERSSLLNALRNLKAKPLS
ncbi:MAG: hypothetical protein WCA08_22940 [Desulfoferrobacter sp.]